MFDLEAIEETCESQEITLVVHPAIRRAIKGFEESFYIGLRCFLTGETDGVYFLPLKSGGYEQLGFSRRVSSGGHTLLRVAPLAAEGLGRIKLSLGDAHQKA